MCPTPLRGDHRTCKNWLKSRFHLNFAEHRGGENQYGVMRVSESLAAAVRGACVHPSLPCVCVYVCLTLVSAYVFGVGRHWL